MDFGGGEEDEEEYEYQEVPAQLDNEGGDLAHRLEFLSNYSSQSLQSYQPEQAHHNPQPKQRSALDEVDRLLDDVWAMNPFKPKNVNAAAGNSIGILSADFKFVDIMRSLNMSSSPLKTAKAKEHQKENIFSE